MPDKSLTHGYDVLMVSFKGRYPDGSMGRKQAHYIKVMTMHGIHAFDPVALILDFRELDYRWGNGLLGVYQDVSQFKNAENEPGEPPFPVATITGPHSTAGFLSLTTPVNGDPPESHFVDVEKAVHWVAQKAKEWMDW